ncbi:hypothetical protein [Hoeflea sp. AS16]|uniref:hypothetical protein n=1 Tax=Hoeflea sp. AS16 TaxID=3135779 RepID=UPI00316C34AF
MNALIRLTILFLATTFSIIVFSGLFETFNAFPDLWSKLGNGVPHQQTGYLFPIGSLFWGAMFRAPWHLFAGTLPLLLVFMALEFGAKPRRWVYLSVWVLAGFLAEGILFGVFSRAVAAIVAALIAGQVFWWLAGRQAGRWRQQPAYTVSGMIKRAFGGYRPLNLLAYAIVAFLAYQLSGHAVYAGKMVWVSFISEPDAGTPPYKYKRKRDFTVFHKVALLKFPDAKSCLPDDMEGLSPENLKKMDWSKIENSAEAEVCGFRLLGSNPDISHATEWFEAQGMTVPEDMSGASPYKGLDGKLRVTASWSISKNGPKFSQYGPLRRLLFFTPYGMSISSTWSPDGKKLIDYDVYFLFL